MKRLLFLCFIVIFSAKYAHAADICNLPDGGLGKCVALRDCPAIDNLIIPARKNPDLAKYISGLRCDPGSKVIKVCCSDCYTPEGKRGTCVDITECPSLLTLAKSNLNYVQNSLCLSGTSNVCCGPHPAPLKRGGCQEKLTAFPPDQDSQCCGIDAYTGVRIIGGTSTAIDQYPWLALLEYKKNNMILLLCGGSLISNKYVLTAAHCVHDKKPVSVRLGEYDIEHDGRDCVATEGGGVDCTDAAVSIPIKEIIKHPDYDKNLNRNDIALIRLDGVANYTDFIRPICLPNTDVTTSKNFHNLKVHVCGWGKMNWNIQNSRLKQHVKLSMVDLQRCQNMYHAKVQPEPHLWSNQLCAGGEKGKDSCNGDSGGPLMLQTSRKDNTTVVTMEGLVSFGPWTCGTEDVAGVYTKVYAYNTWIRRNIKP